MNISVEKTPKQSLSKYVIDTAVQISITHLPGTPLYDVIESAKRLNDQAGAAKSIPHIGARNLTSETELHENLIDMKKSGIDKILIIGGGTRTGKAYRSADQILPIAKEYGFQCLCGVYPQNEDFQFAELFKYNRFDGGISQLCLNTRMLNTWVYPTRIGVPSNCSVKGLIKYLKICGLTDSVGYVLDNLNGIWYIDRNGFNTGKFVKKLVNKNIHVYNFGKLDQTLMQLEFI